MGLNKSALCGPVSFNQPESFRFRPSCGRAQGFVELSLGYFMVLVPVIYLVNGQPSMLMWVLFFAHLIATDITIYLGNIRSWL